MSVYIDTSAFLAIMDRGDPRNADATTAWNALLDSDEELVTSSYVLVETVSLLHRRFGTALARAFAEDAFPALEIDWAVAAGHAAAMSGLLTSSGKAGPSIVDCMGFAMIERRRIAKVFAYDRHFSNRGLRLVG